VTQFLFLFFGSKISYTVVENNFLTTLILFFFFGFEETSPLWKVHFVCPGEGVKPWLSQALTRGASPDSNSRLAVQISNSLPSRYAPWGYFNSYKDIKHKSNEGLAMI